MDRYEARINLHGTTQRERAKNRLITHLNDKTQHSLSCKDILLNGVKTQLIINSGTQPYYKEFQSLPDQQINIGDYIEWANSHWIVTTCDSDDELYRDGKLEQCNYLLKWQNELGEIVERWSIIKSASKYNDGTTSNDVLSLGSDQLSVIIPLDKEVIKLKKSMGKKFFIDSNKEDPTTYELTGTGNVPDTYNGHGITSWIVKECAYTATEDDLKYGVCNYKSVDTTPDENPDETTVLTDNVKATISGNKNLKVGYARTYTVTFTDAEENVVDDMDFSWNIVSDFEVGQTVNGNEIELLVDDEDCIDSLFYLQIINSDNKVIAEIGITVIGLI